MADETSKKQKFSTTITYVFIILPIIVTILVMIFWSKKPPSPNDTAWKSSYVQAQINQSEKGSVTLVKKTPNSMKFKVVAPIGKRIAINVPCKFKSWKADWDGDYGTGNQYGLYEVRLNEDNNLIKKEGRLPSGKITYADFDTPAWKIEFVSLFGKKLSAGNQERLAYLPVYLEVDLMK